MAARASESETSGSVHGVGFIISILILSINFPQMANSNYVLELVLIVFHSINGKKKNLLKSLPFLRVFISDILWTRWIHSNTERTRIPVQKWSNSEFFAKIFFFLKL